MKKILKKYWPYMRSYKLQYVIVLVGMILTVSATAATAQIMQPLMDDMFIAKDPKMIYLIPMMLIGIYVAKSVGRYLQSVFMNYIGLSIVTRLRSHLLEKMLHMEMGFLHANRSGELISRIINDIGRVQYFVSNMLPELVREVITVFALVGYVIYLSPSLAFYALIVIPLAIYPLILVAKRLKRLSHRTMQKGADVMTRLSEVFNNAEVIKAHSTERYELDRFDVENQHFFRLHMKAVYTNELISPTLETIASFGIAGVIFIGGKHVYDGDMSVGEFTAFLTAVGLVFQPVRRIGSIYGKVQDAVAASERVFDILQRDAAIIDGETVLSEPITSIVFDRVALDYGEKRALSDISVTIGAGNKIALVGGSGGGKSSLVNLLLRFYDVAEGELLINGRDVREYTLSSLREQIAIVSQRVYIMQDTLAENVAYGHEVDEARVIDALKLADAYDFVASLDEGIHTRMQEGGNNLSGGQRQRIAIARAIYKNASVLILDEATSALDNETEKRIQAALDAYTRDKISITIAHRLSTIEHADRLYLFEQGRIVGTGNYDELLEHSELFRRMARQPELF